MHMHTPPHKHTHKQYITAQPYRTINSSTPTGHSNLGVVTIRKKPLRSPVLWDHQPRVDVLLSIAKTGNNQQHAYHHVHSRIRLLRHTTQQGGTTLFDLPPHSPPDLIGCYCKITPCQQVGFLIFTTTTHLIHLYLHDRYPSEYLIPLYVCPGINTIAWCPRTLFTHRGQLRLPKAALRMASTDPTLTCRVWKYSPLMQFTPLDGSKVSPHPLEEMEEEAELPNIPSIITILPPVPPLWSLCRLALGLPGVTRDGIIDLPPTCFDIKQWGMYKGVLGHDTSPR